VTRQNTRDVELNGFKISAVEEAATEAKGKNLVFLHGLLGQGRNWRSFALNDVVRAIQRLIVKDIIKEGCVLG
jgi:hypothetical protein